jgi:hypothetical protein
MVNRHIQTVLYQKLKFWNGLGNSIVTIPAHTRIAPPSCNPDSSNPAAINPDAGCLSDRATSPRTFAMAKPINHSAICRDRLTVPQDNPRVFRESYLFSPGPRLVASHLNCLYCKAKIFTWTALAAMRWWGGSVGLSKPACSKGNVEYSSKSRWHG